MLGCHSIMDHGGKTGTQTMTKPLDRFSLFHTHDADEARELVSRVYCDHRLTPKGRTDVNALHNHARLSGVSVNYMEYGSDIYVEPGYLKDFYLFQLPLEGAAEIETGGKMFQSTRHTPSVINPTEYTRMCWSADCRKLLLQVKPAAITERLSRILMRPVEKPLLFDSQVQDNNRHAQSWWRHIAHLIQDLDNGLDPWRSRFLLEDLERNILTGILYSFSHNYSETLMAQESCAVPRHVKLAEDYIMEHLQENISIDDLVNVAGVSERSLFDGFKNFRGTTPMKYILKLRLARVREDLLRGSEDSNVTRIATKWGFSQLGRFAVNYRKVYGETPSETLRRRTQV